MSFPRDVKHRTVDLPKRRRWNIRQPSITKNDEAWRVSNYLCCNNKNTLASSYFKKAKVGGGKRFHKTVQHYSSANLFTLPIVSTYSLHTNKWVWEKRGAYYLVHGDLQRQHPFGTLPWGLLALCRRTLGSKRRRYAIAWPNKLGTDPMAHGGLNNYMGAAAELRRNPVSKHQIRREYGNEQADAGRDCRTRLARPNSQARTGTGKYSFSRFSCTRSGLATLPSWSFLLLYYVWWPYIIHTVGEGLLGMDFKHPIYNT